MGKLTWLLIAINVIVFELVFSLPSQEPIFQMFAFSSGTSLEIWRWFTSMFLHVSASHLFFNMLGLYFFGKILEEHVSAKWFIGVFIVTGLFGNFIFMLIDPSFVIGASGAVFGLMGAAMLLNPIKRIHMYIFPLPLGIVAILFLLVETFVIQFQPAEFANVANIAHIAGLLAGALFAFIYDWKKSVEGLMFLIICLLLLMILGPVFGIITAIGAFILAILESIIGFFLYGIAKVIGLIWI